ncbi:MAG: glycosyltransferase family A protein [Sterolibacterium sp.]
MSGKVATLCYITTCKGRLEHLKRTLPRVVNQPDVSCVVVDYACPDNTADWVAANFPQVTVVRVTGEAGFNAARARNLGARAANAPWLAFFDADILWSPQFAATVIPCLEVGHFYRADPVTLQSWGSIICHRRDFAEIGGYDEAFAGWGGEDDDLLARLAMLGRGVKGFPAALVDEISHADDARVRFHEVKDRTVQRRINALYFQIKLDAMRLMGDMLSLETRQALFDEVRRIIGLAAEEGSLTATVEVTLPPWTISPPPLGDTIEQWLLGRKLTYSITHRNSEKA